MKTIIFLFAIIFLLMFGLAASQEFTKTGKFPFLNAEKTPTATINNHTFKLLVAKTSQEKDLGLGKRKSLDKNSGMLFLFDNADYYAFWAKDMQFPIDIIFISDNRIVTIYPNVAAPKHTTDNLPILKPKEPIDKVLEINAGLSKKYQFNLGDEVKVEDLQ